MVRVGGRREGKGGEGDPMVTINKANHQSLPLVGSIPESQIGGGGSKKKLYIHTFTTGEGEREREEKNDGASE